MSPLCDVCDEVPGRIVYVSSVTYDDMMVCFSCFQVLKKKD